MNRAKFFQILKKQDAGELLDTFDYILEHKNEITDITHQEALDIIADTLQGEAADAFDTMFYHYRRILDKEIYFNYFAWVKETLEIRVINCLQMIDIYIEYIKTAEVLADASAFIKMLQQRPYNKTKDTDKEIIFNTPITGLCIVYNKKRQTFKVNADKYLEDIELSRKDYKLNLEQARTFYNDYYEYIKMHNVKHIPYMAKEFAIDIEASKPINGLHYSATFAKKIIKRGEALTTALQTDEASKLNLLLYPYNKAKDNSRQHYNTFEICQ